MFNLFKLNRFKTGTKNADIFILYENLFKVSNLMFTEVDFNANGNIFK